jgi:dGTPase
MADTTFEYHNFSPDFIDQVTSDRENHVENPYCTPDSAVVRRLPRDMAPRLHRPPFQRDVEKIINIPPYNRYAGKTQVFSFIRNDDISRRGLHVQLVAHTARTIGKVLGLNDDLIEAIALGHDLGHTPFGHAGEHMLDKLYFRDAGRHFNHNVHSVRILDKLYVRNVSLQTLDGIICHNGESSQKTFTTSGLTTFDEFDEMYERCYTDQEFLGHLRPATLEGCVVRISDMIAYVGKDRQDALNTGALSSDVEFDGGVLGTQNAKIINNLVVDICEHSYMKDHIAMSDEAFRSLKTAKAENYEKIYLSDAQGDVYKEQIEPMFSELYDQILADLRAGNKAAPVFRHFVNPIMRQRFWYESDDPYLDEPAESIAVDYLASMTDDYFLAAHRFMCPDSEHDVQFRDYFTGFSYTPAM